MNEFKEFGLSDQLLENLKDIGITEPTEIQRKTLPLTLKGRDVIGGSATGSGKTIAFSASLIENMKSRKEINGVQALILTPTRELAEQVSEAIKQVSKGFPVKVVPVYGGVSIEKQINQIPHANIVVGTPGRILDHFRRKTLSLSHVKYLVLDEVDRMFEMGFQEDVEKIIRPCPKDRQTLMFSATVSAELDYLAKKHTKNPEKVVVKSLVDPTKLRQVFYDVQPNKKFSLLVQLLKQEESGGVMVFCNTRNNVDFVARNLQLNDIDARAIHGGLNQNKRQEVLDKFHKKETKVLVCTDVAARGLDIKGVTHIYNYDIPDNSKEYIHRIGRTARAGEEGIAINIITNKDYITFSDIEGDKNLNIEKLDHPPIQRAKMKVLESDRKGKSKNRSGKGRFNNKSHGRGRGEGRGRNFKKGKGSFNRNKYPGNKKRSNKRR